MSEKFDLEICHNLLGYAKRTRCMKWLSGRNRADFPLAKRLLFQVSGNLRLGRRSRRTVVGFMTATVDYATWSATHFAHMDCLFIDAEFRSFGIGRRFFKCLEEFCRERKFALAQWQTPPDNLLGIGFYNRMGATSKPKIRFFYDCPPMKIDISKFNALIEEIDARAPGFWGAYELGIDQSDLEYAMRQDFACPTDDDLASVSAAILNQWSQKGVQLGPSSDDSEPVAQEMLKSVSDAVAGVNDCAFGHGSVEMILAEQYEPIHDANGKLIAYFRIHGNEPLLLLNAFGIPLRIWQKLLGGGTRLQNHCSRAVKL